MKLLIQPQDGVAPLVAAVKKAKKSVDIVIFRFGRVLHLTCGLSMVAPYNRAS
jgi:hypothetical protein